MRGSTAPSRDPPFGCGRSSSAASRPASSTTRVPNGSPASDRACSMSTRDRVALAAGLRDERSRSAAMADVARTLRSEGALPGWRDELYRDRRHVRRRAAFFTSSAAPRAISAFAPTPRTSTASCAPRDRRRCGLRAAARRKPSIPACSTTSSAAASAPDLSVRDTVIKEAWEEAGIGQALAATAQPAGAVHLLRYAAGRVAARNGVRARPRAAARISRRSTRTAKRSSTGSSTSMRRRAHDRSRRRTRRRHRRRERSSCSISCSATATCAVISRLQRAGRTALPWRRRSGVRR